MPDRIHLQLITEAKRGSLWVPTGDLKLWKLLGAGPGEQSGALQPGDLVLLKPAATIDAGGFAWGSDVCVYWRDGELCRMPGDVVLDATRPQQEGLVQAVHARRQVAVGQVLTGEHKGLWALLLKDAARTILDLRGKTLVVCSEDALAMVSEEPVEVLDA